jgi:hypothetical protein
MPIGKSELYSSLWRSCTELRGGTNASQYKDLGGTHTTAWAYGLEASVVLLHYGSEEFRKTDLSGSTSAVLGGINTFDYPRSKYSFRWLLYRVLYSPLADQLWSVLNTTTKKEAPLNVSIGLIKCNGQG